MQQPILVSFNETGITALKAINITGAADQHISTATSINGTYILATTNNLQSWYIVDLETILSGESLIDGAYISSICILTICIDPELNLLLIKVFGTLTGILLFLSLVLFLQRWRNDNIAVVYTKALASNIPKPIVQRPLKPIPEPEVMVPLENMVQPPNQVDKTVNINEFDTSADKLKLDEEDPVINLVIETTAGNSTDALDKAGDSEYPDKPLYSARSEDTYILHNERTSFQEFCFTDDNLSTCITRISPLDTARSLSARRKDWPRWILRSIQMHVAS
jgi:hypothetical protein